ncbi:MAG TPA: PSD1 and planctomycete cytochrome C domain-containing protein [Gemmataceae bacterium]|nr:PSD1 and planctomycete cytochrome C domain-containing protein [Gemmataceae bacterium]
MRYAPRLHLFLIALAAAALAGSKTAAAGPDARLVEFNRDIRPILADNCYACHGPDKKQRKADLRLDTEEGAFADRGDYRIITPGKPERSEIYRRISSADPKVRMPQPRFGKNLTAKQVETIRLWIAQGAKWQKHWSLIPPNRQDLPPVKDPSWPRNAIDHFILARLDQEGLTRSVAADRRTLLRRLSFDLIGLPPTPEEMNAFLADRSPDAYARQVDRLLGSKHFGERMAMYWLDLVRFADTGGYHSDNHRDVYLYRDYVIGAFNDNKPFDRFTIEQLAGDLLPGATREQKIASGYNRMLMTTEEGGAQAKEYMAKYSADRVRNVSTVWLAATLGCTECHDHKFDPFLTREFYSLAAFFADVKEIPVGRQEQTPLPNPDQAARMQRLDAQMAPLQQIFDKETPELDASQAKWEATVHLIEMRGKPKNLVDILLLEPGKRSPAQKQALAAYYRGIAPELESVRKQLAGLQRQKDQLTRAVPTSLVSIAVNPRVMRVLPRGNWLDDSGAIVAAGVPASLGPLPVTDRRATRLELAQWMMGRDNPLVARVFVNRLWKLLFGQGIVKTLDDFGAQGAWPTHPELLDWLAVEFRDSGWNVKHMIRLMVLSATYRQSSAVNELLRQRDPYNGLLARQGRFRLDAEMVRDSALAVSGLLAGEVGGPSVKPYQPAGYWAMLNFPVREWQKDQGENLYRRGLYTYWCRTFPHPSLVAFDAPSREECAVERPRSNTPLQALVLLNDPTYVEAARAFAERIIRKGGDTPEQRIQFAYRQALCRSAQPEELRVLASVLGKHLEQYTADQKAAAALLHVGNHPAAKDLTLPELAAWTSVARVILNLHEIITRD